jgi:uncharacterized repeat protein (TIGR03806 family)
VGSQRLFLGELKGRVWSFLDDPGCKQADLALDLARIHPDCSALYGLTIHPRFAENRFVYICYVRQNNQPDGSVVSRFEVTRDEPPVIDPKSERVILTFWSGGHNGGCLVFGNDGYLYLSTGDGTDPSPPDSKLTGQDCSDLLSSILRIDVDHADTRQAYRVPPDNPFVRTPGVRPEIWAFGFRNPWKMSIDRATGDLWVGDVGWELWEMIDRVVRGGNYGWSITEGPQPVFVEGKRGPTPILPPLIAHPHSEAASITGGYVYHGKRLPELAGAYLYGDYQTGTVWGLRHDGKAVTWQKELARTPIHLVAFGETNSGELYLVDHDRTHKLYRLIANPEQNLRAEFPRRLSQTGLFASTRQHQPASGVVPFAINVELWSDGATAERFLAVPGEGRISVDEQGNWKFPGGSVLVRTVSIRDGPDHAQSRRRIETQILHFEDGSWRPYSYVWTDDQTDALLTEAGGSTKTVIMADPASPGGRRRLEYRIHARTECVLCHNPWVERKTTVFGRQSASPLSMNALQLHNDQLRGGFKVNQLRVFEQMGLLNWSPNPKQFPGLASIHDEKADLERRARSYLHVNCAHCHQFNAGGTANIALGFDVPLDQTRTVEVLPIQGSFGIDGARIIAAGDPARSILYYRFSKLGGGRMPRVGSNDVDVAAARLIHDWIAGMKPPPGGSGAQAQNQAAAEKDKRALSELRSAGSSLPQARVAIGRLCSSTRGALLLVSEVNRGNIPAEVRREIATIARENPRVEVRDLFERFIPESERARRLGDSVDRGSVLALRGNAERGRLFFATHPGAQCKTCHKVGSIGESVGPDLSKIGSKYDKPALLEHLLEPSKTIDPQYATYLVATKDGQVATGIVVERSDSAIVLKDAQGKTVRIPRDQVEQLSLGPKSLMPELLLRDLTAQQAADLLEFLAAQK